MKKSFLLILFFPVLLWAQSDSDFDFDETEFEEAIQNEEAESFDFSEEDFSSDLEDVAPVTEPKLNPKTRIITTKKGSYIYHPNQEKGLYKINRSNHYLYDYQKSPKKGFINIKGGNFNLEDFPQENSATKYESLYDSTNLTAFYFEYEWAPFKFIKKIPGLNLMVSGGLSYARGRGRFVSEALSGSNAQEGYNLMLFPFSAGLTYKLRLTPDPLILPFASAALDYNVLTEFRSSFKSFKYTGIFGAHLSAGVALNLGWLERSSALDLDRDYGINNSYLSVELRQLQSFYDEWNLNGTIILAGLSFEY